MSDQIKHHPHCSGIHATNAFGCNVDKAMTSLESQQKEKEVAEKIVNMTGYGHIRVNDILPDLKELTHTATQAERERSKNMADAAEWLWGVVANASGSDWGLQSEEWRKAAVAAREAYYAALDSDTTCTCASFFTVRGTHKADCPAFDSESKTV